MYVKPPWLNHLVIASFSRSETTGSLSWKPKLFGNSHTWYALYVVPSSMMDFLLLLYVNFIFIFIILSYFFRIWFVTSIIANISFKTIYIAITAIGNPTYEFISVYSAIVISIIHPYMHSSISTPAILFIV